MTIPVVKQVLLASPSLQILFISCSSYAPLFVGIDRLQFVGADLKGRHKGLVGMWRLMKDCKAMSSIYAVADLHSVLRTWCLGLFFRLAGTQVACISKGRFQKWQLTRRWNKIKKPLISTFERYQRVFHELNIPVLLKTANNLSTIENKNNVRIGIAPFAKHQGKMLPLSTMKQTAQLIQQQLDCTIFLFGAPGYEAGVLNEWASEIPQVINCAGVGSFQEELDTLSTLDLFISMDSANMHLASLYSVPVISIWGATHPFAGFLGWGQSINQTIKTDLPCQPCSVFGNKTCYRGDWACLNAIQPQQILERVRAYLCV